MCGGSGLVGGDIVLNLLSRGQSPSSIRILDFSKPSRSDMTCGEVAALDFVKTDITDTASVEAAFAKPWPSDVAHLPLTVFHTVATIRRGERSLLLWERTSRANVDGTRNVLAGADIFVATSSASVSLRPGNGIYGQPKDVICGSMLKQQKVASFTPHIIQQQVAGWNVSLAHLAFEAALAPAVCCYGYRIGDTVVRFLPRREAACRHTNGGHQAPAPAAVPDRAPG